MFLCVQKKKIIYMCTRPQTASLYIMCSTTLYTFCVCIYDTFETRPVTSPPTLTVPYENISVGFF